MKKRLSLKMTGMEEAQGEMETTASRGGLNINLFNFPLTQGCEHNVLGHKTGKNLPSSMNFEEHDIA